MSRSTRVLHVYSGNLFGGVERMLISLTGVNASEFEHEFALCFEGKLADALRSRGATVRLLEPVRMRRPLSVLRARRALARLLRSRHFDAVVHHGIWSYGIFATVAARAGHSRILYLHDIPEPENWLYRWSWRAPPNLCIANSACSAARLPQSRRGVRVEIVHPLVEPPSPPSLTAVEALRSSLGVRPGEVVILQASRLDPWKGHRNLLRALAALRTLPGWRCWIAGSPQRPAEHSYREELRRMVESAGLASRVSFIGHRDDMDRVLAACDVYCQPNETPEPFGMVFVEAMYAGKPVIGSALGGSLEIVTPECGVLCSPNSAELTAALERLIVDGSARVAMSHAGPAHALALCGREEFERRFRAALEIGRDAHSHMRRS